MKLQNTKKKTFSQLAVTCNEFKSLINRKQLTLDQISQNKLQMD